MKCTKMGHLEFKRRRQKLHFREPLTNRTPCLLGDENEIGAGRLLSYRHTTTTRYYYMEMEIVKTNGTKTLFSADQFAVILILIEPKPLFYHLVMLVFGASWYGYSNSPPPPNSFKI